MKKWAMAVVVVMIGTGLAQTGPAVFAEGDEGRATVLLERFLGLDARMAARGAQDPAARVADVRGRAQVTEGRRAILGEVTKLGPAAIPAIKKAIAATDQAQMRSELVGALGEMPGMESANALSALLDDPDEPLRQVTINTLRLLTRRVDRLGPERTQRGEEFPAKRPELVPLLMKAAGDKAEMNRYGACYALADSLDAGAMAMLRQLAVKDPAGRVRVTASCLLTEFHDASGLEEMKKAMHEMAGEERGRLPFGRVMLLASMNRITGKSFGALPPEPGLLSSLERAREAEGEIQRQMEAWAAWWAWVPEKK